jgi:ribosomal protein S18 acetylase RimI-like enzyme
MPASFGRYRSPLACADMTSTYVRVMSRLGKHAGLRVFRIFGRRLRERADAAAQGVVCRLLKEREALALCADPALDLVPLKVQAAFARGDVCVGGFQHGVFAGYCWFALSPLPQLDGAWLEFPDHVVYTYKSYVRPAFRGRGIAAAMYRFADALFLKQGRTHAVLCVESHNEPSIAAARRSGFADAGFAAYVGGQRLRAWRSRAAAGYGLRFFLPE